MHDPPNAPPLITYDVYGVTVSTPERFLAPVPRTTASPDIDFTVSDESVGGFQPSRVLYQSPQSESQGATGATYQQGTDGDLFEVDGVADFLIRRDRIECFRRSGCHPLSIEPLVLGTVLSLWLERESVPVLHAAAAVVEGEAIGFLGTNGSGKSSLAASLCQAGYPLLCDDTLPVARRGARWWGRPGYPQMRMWPSQAAHFTERDDFTAVVPWTEKLRVPVGAGGLGTFHPHPAPIRTLYVPQRSADAVDIAIEPVSPVRALATLLGASFLAPLLVDPYWQARRLPALADLAEKVPVRLLTYPSGLEHLPSVRAAVLKNHQ